MTDTSRMPILIVEDEPEIRKFLRATLTNAGYKPVEAETVKDGLREFSMQRPALVILDLGLPDQDGKEFIKEARQWNTTPIIVLSARGQEQDKIDALDAGADDYLTKPFGTGELLARLKVALRHAQSATTEAVFTLGQLKIDFTGRVVTIGGKDIHLTPIEYALLTALAKHAGKVVTHRQLIKEIWNRYAPEDNNQLRIHMQHLRRKLGDDALNPTYILTEPGVGYRLKIPT